MVLEIGKALKNLKTKYENFNYEYMHIGSSYSIFYYEDFRNKETLMGVRYDPTFDQVRVNVMNSFHELFEDENKLHIELSNELDTQETLEQEIENNFVTIANTLGGAPIKSSYNQSTQTTMHALDIEIELS